MPEKKNQLHMLSTIRAIKYCYDECYEDYWGAFGFISCFLNINLWENEHGENYDDDDQVDVDDDDDDDDDGDDDGDVATLLLSLLSLLVGNGLNFHRFNHV